MKILSNQKYIDRNVKITKYITWASLGVLGLGIYLTITQKESTQTLIFTFGALLIGFTLSQISIYMQNRWGKSPRPDELIAASLKGLDDKYTLYLFNSPVPHLLVSPNGIWGILAYSQKGTISYTGTRWKLKGGNTFRKIFAGDTIGRPDLDCESLVSDYTRGLSKKVPDLALPELNIALVFTHPDVVIEAENAPVSTIPIKKLKDLIRKRAKNEMIPQGTVDAINESLIK
jgi:hypothetical protein